MSESFHTVVIGAGITGLAVSRALAARGAHHVVLEATVEPGGAIRTRTVGGHVLEQGPQRTRLTPPLQRLISELGIGGEVIAAPARLPLFVYARGRLRRAPLSLAQLVTTDLLPPAAKARAFLEPLTAPAKNGESVARFFTRRFGRTAYERLLGPLFGGLYASDPADMPVRHALAPALRELGIGRSAIAALLRKPIRSTAAPPINFRRGMQTLTDAMYASVTAHVRLNTPARAIARAGGGYTVTTGTEELHARNVVLTTPAPAAAALLHAVAPAAAAALGRLRYNPIAIAYLEAQAHTHGLGYQVAFGETLETRGVTFNHDLFGRENLYTAFLGGARAASLVERADTDILEIAAREFALVTGRPAHGIAVARADVPAWDTTWDALDDVDLPDGIHLAANYESRIGIPGRLARAERVAAALDE